MLFWLGIDPKARSLLRVFMDIDSVTINHFLDMYEIELYARSEQDIIHLTRIYRENVGMSFGQEKSG